MKYSHEDGTLFTKEEFLQKLKTDKDFNNRYGRKHITEGKMVLPPCHYGFQVYTRELSLEERYNLIEEDKHTQFVNWQSLGTDRVKEVLDKQNIPTRTREPYPLPTLKHLRSDDKYTLLNEFSSLWNEFKISDFEMENYQSHPTIKAPLSN